MVACWNKSRRSTEMILQDLGKAADVYMQEKTWRTTYWDITLHSLSLYIYFMLGMETGINWEFLENQWQIFYVYCVTSPFKLYFTNFVTKSFDEQSSNSIDIHYHFENQITFLHISRHLYYVSHTDVLLVKIICNKTGNQTMFNNLSSGSTYFKHIIDHN